MYSSQYTSEISRLFSETKHQEFDIPSSPISINNATTSSYSPLLNNSSSSQLQSQESSPESILFNYTQFDASGLQQYENQKRVFVDGGTVDKPEINEHARNAWEDPDIGFEFQRKAFEISKESYDISRILNTELSHDIQYTKFQMGLETPNRVRNSQMDSETPNIISNSQMGSETQNKIWNSQLGSETPNRIWNSQMDLETQNKMWITQMNSETPNRVWNSQMDSETLNKIWNSQVGSETPNKILNSQVGSETSNKILNSQMGPETPNRNWNSQMNSETPNKIWNSQMNSETPNKIWNSQMGKETPNKIWNLQVGSETPNKILDSQMGSESPNRFLNSQMGSETPNRYWNSQMGFINRSFNSQMGSETPNSSWNSQMGSETANRFWNSHMGSETPNSFRNSQIGFETESPKRTVETEIIWETPKKFWNKENEKSLKTSRRYWDTEPKTLYQNMKMDLDIPITPIKRASDNPTTIFEMSRGTVEGTKSGTNVQRKLYGDVNPIFDLPQRNSNAKPVFKTQRTVSLCDSDDFVIWQPLDPVQTMRSSTPHQSYELFPNVKNAYFRAKTPTPPTSLHRSQSQMSMDSRNSARYMHASSLDQSFDQSSLVNYSFSPSTVFDGPPVYLNIIKPNYICTFCRKNGETPSVYTSHMVKMKDGKKTVVTCPILRSLVCTICHQSGDNAHTLTYCPELRRRNNGQPLKSTTVYLKNTRVKSNGRKRY